MPTLTQLEYIVAVAETGSFSKAAHSCNVSQPSLSAQIQKAEDLLETVIFDRSQKPVVATVLGRDIVEQAYTVIKEHRRLYDIVSEAGELRGSLRVGIIPSLSPYLLPLFIESFSARYPKLSVKVNELKTEDIVSALDKKTLDLGILVTPLGNSQYIERPLFEEQFKVFTSAEHPLYEKKYVLEKHLDLESVWLLEEGHCFRDQVMAICKLKKDRHVLHNVDFEGGSLETLINLIRRGKGYTLLPDLATVGLNDEERKNHLKLFKSPVPSREVSLYYHKQDHRLKAIEALENAIKENLPATLTEGPGDRKIVRP